MENLRSTYANAGLEVPKLDEAIAAALSVRVFRRNTHAGWSS